MTGMPDLPHRTGEHERLDFMVGEWTTREEYPPAPWMPLGGSGEGRATIRWTVGEMVLITDYEARGAMGRLFQGHGIMTWDPSKERLLGTWFDTMMPAGIHGEGRWEEERLVIRYRHETPRGVQEIRSVATPVADGEFRMVGSSLVEGRWVEAVRITYTRA